MATLAAVTNIPALGLVGEDGKLERATEPFRRWYEENAELCRESPELGRVLEGQANAAVLKLDGIAIDIAAMADRDGGRHIMLTLPTSALPSIGDAGEALLDGALDESPALVWLKDLEGRYVRVNSRFTTLLNTTEERLLGRTDAEVPPAETVDGPRAEDREEGVEEPLQLEYVVGPYQGREALAVLRFPVRDRQGTPALVCGVAAPSSEAQVARSEAARLLRVERWSRLDAESVRAELLADWGLLPDARGRIAATPGAESAPGSAEQEAAVAEARAERATAVAERDTALSANEKLTGDLEAAQTRVAELEKAVQAARAGAKQGDAEAKLAEQAAELDRALTRERERAEELERTLTLVRQRLGDDAEAARAEVQRARADAEAARTEVQRARADAEAARTDLEKARADAEAVRTAASAERESAAKATGELERSLRQSQDQLAALERQQGTDDTGAQLRAAEKARIAAEAALVDATAERDATLKARAALEGELAQEHKQVAALREGIATVEDRLRELTGELERERVRAAGVEPAQARVQELERELRSAGMRADKAEVEFQVFASRVEKAEGDLKAVLGRADQTEGELRLAVGRADKAEAAVEQWQARAKQVEPELERGRARVQALEDKLEQERARTAELEGQRTQDRARIEALEGKLSDRQARVAEVEGERKLDRARIEELEGERKLDRARIEELESALERARAQAEEGEKAVADLEARLEEAESQPAPVVAEEPAPAVAPDEPEDPAPVEPAPVESEPPAPTVAELARLEAPVDASAGQIAGGVSWQPTAKRTLSASLARESVWRNVLKETVEVLGSEGGWDTVTAWLPDDANKLDCAATWTAHRGLDRFETLTWEVPVNREGSLLDQALQAPHLTWLTDIDAVDDARLQTAAAHGMSSALLLPVRSGTSTIGLLELLTHDSIEPDAQIALSLEASALQLGRFGHLLSLGKSS
ncbi:MAG TPA: PAS domain-containing protein [Solirubrobacteraceae bacterium]|nr:PAS domain-containing protein [Solirubrobacteraceae bacterium]